MKPEDALEAVKFLGINASNIEEFKSQFEGEFIRTSNVEEHVKKNADSFKGLFGNRFGAIETQLKGIARTFEVDINGDDFKDKDLENKAKKLAEIVSNKYTTEKSSYEERLKTNDPNKITAEWEKKVKALEKERDEQKLLLETTSKEYEGFKTEVVTKEINHKKAKYFNDNFESLRFSKEVDELKKIGFKSILKDKYKEEVDDKGEVFYVEAATGNKIKSAKAANKFADAAEIMEKEALERKLLDMTPNQNQQTTKPAIDLNQINPNNNQGDVKKRPIAQAAIDAAAGK